MEIRNLDHAIDVIDAHHPIDSEYADCNAVGRDLMFRAIEATGFDWRDLPEAVLRYWAQLCLDRSDRQCREAERSYR